MINIYFKKIVPTAEIPKYKSAGAAGMDISIIDPVWIPPGETQMVKTGLAVEVPNGYELQIRPRSGLSKRFPNYLMNSPGTIDCDYRGEIMLMLVNNNQQGEVMICHIGERVAQAVVAPVEKCMIGEAKMLTPTERGTGGFGSTGR